MKFNSLHFTAQVRLFFVQKGNLKCFGLKNVMDVQKNQKNSHFGNMLNCTQNFGENNTEALLDSK